LANSRGFRSSVFSFKKKFVHFQEVEEEKALRMYRSAKDAMRLPTEAAEFEKHRKQKK
jgi:hypothetical protein